ncbi:hypothetical protein [Actinoplanes digitatis]|uniref:Uncharacterized protein n=1 Tax=Actinoplanes digitatis TaxID=1868 RepID=A0A7W7MQC9_9ACTN|nr:hypothetical protein [Actinoplanes digitatis]MBB4763043.1 hypothetical protein [Actinoplanes digitatis]
MAMFPSPPIPSSHESRPSRFAGMRAGPIGKILIGVVALTVAGLVTWDIVDTSTRERLTFTYVSQPGDGMMDQLLLIDNDDATAVTPTLSFTALDGSGEPLPGVTVTTAYGSDRGGLVVPPGGGYDVLIFGGQPAGEVADVRVTVDDAPTVRFPSHSDEVDVTALDDQGLSTTGDGRIAAVELTNTNGVPVTVRLVYLVWSDSEPGQPQQAETVTPIGDLIEISGDGRVTVPVTGQADAANRAAVAANRSASVKAYFATTPSGA